jgi:hypothetical protein
MVTERKIFRKASIGMQEHQHVTLRLACAGVHLQRAAARRGQHAIAKTLGERRRPVVAAAVDDDDLVPALAERRERLQRGADAGGLVQRRDDDRKSFSDQS